jgi:hypothetical protein
LIRPGQYGGTQPPRPPSAAGTSGVDGIWGGALAAACESGAQPAAQPAAAQRAPDLAVRGPPHT